MAEFTPEAGDTPVNRPRGVSGALGWVAGRLGPAPEREWHRLARVEQLPPSGSWSTWLFLAGRGAGKSRAGAEWLLEQATTFPGTDWAIVAPTFGSARDVCLEGPSGLLRCAGDGGVEHYVRSLGEVRLSNGSRIYARSADEGHRLRGLNLSGAWCDELALFRRDAVWYEDLVPAVRIEPARIMVSTTPRGTKLLRDLVGRDDGSVVVSRASTYDNKKNLSKSALAEYRVRYPEGSRLARQELGGELVDDIEGAMWNLGLIDEYRVTETPDLLRTVVAVDPSVSAKGTGDECGIVVAAIAGVGRDAHFYVLADETVRGSPKKWASRVAIAFGKWQADRIVAESNQGVALVEDTLRNVGANLPVKLIHSGPSKATRAEPIVALYEGGRVHHVGVFPELEDQLCSWIPNVGKSPDRLDALVHCLAELSGQEHRKSRMRRYARSETVADQPPRPVAGPDIPFANDPMVASAPRSRWP